jgi:hypothetical protein
VDDKTIIQHAEPVPVLTTGRTGSAPDGTVIETPSGQPDLIVTVMSPLAQVLVRTARTFLQSFIGFLGAGALGKGVLGSLGVEIAPNDLWSVIQFAFGLSLFPTLMAFAQNALELLGRLEASMPKWRA